MGKSIFILVVACFAGLGLQAQGAGPKYSAYTAKFMKEYARLKDKSAHLPGYNYKQIEGKPYISAFFKVNDGVDADALASQGIRIGTRAGKVWTVQVPLDLLPALGSLRGVGYIGFDMPVIPLLDSARKETRADSAQKGILLPQTVTGRNVVVGVIDAGFDFNHPTMYDTTDNRYRIKRVWAQKISGTPPAGFSYGKEFTDSNAMRYRGYDTAILSHGTHVTGIAAGSGYGSSTNNAKYRGMAYESDIVLVGIMPAPGEWVTAGETDIIDGLNYIFNYATAVGKPCVVNLSWGSSLGPHDGNSLFSEACDALTGTGKIFVCAAGNNGEDTVHLRKAFSDTASSVSTFVTFSPYLDSNNQITWVDVWGDTGKTFCLNVKLYDTTTVIDSTGAICLSDTTREFQLIGSNGDTCFVTMAMIDTEYNGKPHAFLKFYSKTHNDICLTTTATSGIVDMWEGYVMPPEGYYGYLKALGRPWAVSGDAKMTVSDIGCTRSAVTVGAYTSKVSFTNINGAALYYPGALHGRIAPFSSFGPTADNRIKPDITAPGFGVSSSVNSYDTSYNSGGTNYIGVVGADTLGPRIYRYAILAGTSMASPCVSGIVGMMLQTDSTLTPDSVKAIIAATAIKDVYTGVLPTAGTTTWGHGKINAYGAVRHLAGVLAAAAEQPDPLNCVLYPNPNKGSFTIEFLGSMDEQLQVELFDATGRRCFSSPWLVAAGRNSKQFFPQSLQHGLYYARITSTHGTGVIKTIVE